MLLFFLTPDRVVFFIALLLKTNVSIKILYKHLLGLKTINNFFDFFYTLDTELYFLAIYKERPYIRTLDNFILLLLIANIFFYVFKELYLFFISTNTNYQNTRNKNKPDFKTTNCMFKMGKNLYKKKPNKLNKEKLIPLYKSKIVRIKELNNTVTEQPHGSVLHISESFGNYKTWGNKFPKQCIFNATTKNKGDRYNLLIL